jgi:hypothetical protein
MTYGGDDATGHQDHNHGTRAGGPCSGTRETATFDCGVPAELFMAKRKTGHDNR